MRQGTLSPVEVAALVGVSESTLKRWIDAGRLRAVKTAGGHRRVAAQDLVAFLRAQGRPVPSLQALGLLRSPGSPGPDTEPDGSSVALADLLLDGNIPAARGVLTGRFGSGTALDALLDDLVAPALSEIGRRWAQGRIDVYQEHVATQRTAELLLDLRALLPSPSPEAPLALGGAPEGDPYILPSLAVELALQELGWRVLNLGPHTPAASLAAAVRRHEPQLVWVSITSTTPATAFLDDYARLQELTEARRIGLIVGGQGLGPDLQRRLVASAFGFRLAHLRAFVRSMSR